jgi:hypothetical protein
MDIPKEFLSKEFLGQFKSQEDVREFLKDLHVTSVRIRAGQSFRV